jgi:5-methylcytosine-specific restriction endonuclease McrA
MLRAWAPPGWSSARLTAATKALVRSGLWHDAETLCDRCTDRHGPLEPGSYRFHDWLDWQFQARAKDDPIFKMRERRRKQLHRRPEIKEAVRTRDRDLCRYCGVAVVFGADHKSPTAGQFDHLDPFDKINSVEGIVTACKACNVAKGERTPDAAGMIVHEPGYQVLIQPNGLDIRTPDPDLSSRDARVGTGPGRDGSPGWIPDREPARNGSSS